MASSYWDEISDRIFENYYHDAVIGQLKRDAHLRLITRWCGDLRGKTVLKTDLFEEAFGGDALVDVLADTYPVVIGMDISKVVVEAARGRIPCAGHAVSAGAPPARERASHTERFVQSKRVAYQHLVPRIREAVRKALPPDASVLVVYRSSVERWGDAREESASTP